MVLSFEIIHRILCILFAHLRVDQRMRQENKTETRPGEQNLKFGVKEGMPHTPLTTKKDKKRNEEMPRFSKNEFTQRNVDAGDASNGKEKKNNKNKNIEDKLLLKIHIRKIISTVDFNC